MVEAVVRQAGVRSPVVVGATSNGLRTTIQYSRAAKEAGAAAVMVSPPRLALPSAETLVGYYGALAGGHQSADRAPGFSAGLRIYDGAGAAGADRAGSAGGAGNQARGPADALEDGSDSGRSGRRHLDLGWAGRRLLPEELMEGASGTMTGFAYPEVLVRVVNLYEQAARMRLPQFSIITSR